MDDSSLDKQPGESDEEFYTRIGDKFSDLAGEHLEDLGNRSHAWSAISEMFLGLLAGGFSRADAALTLGAYLYIAATAGG